jgi:hypothetical protein
MVFISKTDYISIINENVLDDITEVNDEIIEACEARAVAFMSGYLNSRYDVANIFNKTGAERDSTILNYAMDITIYYIHRLVNWRNAPSARVMAYNDAKEWLTKVLDLKINPDLPLLANDSKDYVLTGSNPKRQNHII